MTRTSDAHRTDVDGVPTVRADTPPGRYVGVLMFRVGLRAIELIDRSIDRSLVVCDEHGIDGLADPERQVG